MKTRTYSPQHKHPQHAAARRHALPARTTPVETAPAMPQGETSSLLCSPLEIVRANAQVCDDRLNLIRSTFSDEHGSYLIMSIEVPAPFTLAYDAWTRFDDLPHFMRGGGLSESQDGSRMTWRILTQFDQFAWQAKVCEQRPFDLIAWKSVLGTPHPGFGSVHFDPVSHQQTWIMVQVAFDMSGVCRWLGDPLPSISRSLEQSLRRFHQSVTALSADGAEPAGMAEAAAHSLIP